MINLSSDEQIIITGAGGWLGTELCELLLLHFGSKVLQSSLICLGSRARTIELSDGTTLAVQPLENFTPPTNSHIAGIVHLGFLTRDKFATLGYDNYVSTNVTITANVIRLIETLSPRWVITVSSGAVHAKTPPFLEHDSQTNPYGFTKRIEEELLTNACAAAGSHLCVGRLWGALGAHMPINRNYAVSDFIIQALDEHEITVRARHQVFRKYCDAADFMNVLLAAAASRTYTVTDSGGALIEMSELALAVAKFTDATVAQRTLADGADTDNYFPANTQFESLATEVGVPLRSFSASLSATIEAHRLQAATRDN